MSCLNYKIVTTEKFVKDFVTAWTKVMNLDRFVFKKIISSKSNKKFVT